MDRLGHFNHAGYKISPYRYDPTTERLLHPTMAGTDIYKKVDNRRTRSTTYWELVEAGQPDEATGKVSSVREVEQGRLVIVSTAEPPLPKRMPETTLEVLEEWGSA